MKNIVIGTAGHIDHGKTVLTRALTGVDTDRLPEEISRKMSIDLGFAPFPLTKDLTTSIVDVPGHEKFVKNMVAGVSGVDLILLVVAADDGIMPQTLEHLQILELLGIKYGIVVITKLDVVPPNRVRVVENEIKKLVSSTFLESAPIVGVSATENTGILELKDKISEIAERVEPRRSDHLFRLPIDRVFTIIGFGTVVTGTLISGGVRVGEEVEILPKRRKVRVRAIQVHQTSISQAFAGQRTALNLKDVSKQELRRGDVITSPGVLSSTTLLDVKLKLLDTARKPLKHLTRVRFHVGTSEVMARVAHLELKELLPGEETFAQIRLERPVVTLRKDRFIIRSYSPQLTIGGGVVLNAYPTKHRRNQPGVIENLKVLESLEDRTVIESMLKTNFSSLTKGELLRLTNIPPPELEESLEALRKEGRIICVKNKIVHAQILDKWKQEVMERIETTFANRIYISKGEFIQSFPISEDAAVEAILSQLENDGVIQVKAEKIKLLARLSRLIDWQSKIEAMYKESGYQPPNLDEVQVRIGVEGVQVKDLLSALGEDGTLIEVAPGMVFHRAVLDQSIRLLKDYFKSHPGITVSEFRKLLDTSRKYAVPLLEYFDSIGITVRSGDLRRLKE